MGRGRVLGLSPCCLPLPGGSKYLLNERILCFSLEIQNRTDRQISAAGKGGRAASPLLFIIHLV